MLGALFVLILGATPEVWANMDSLLGDEPECSTEALVAALHALRPDLVVHPWQGERGGAHLPEGSMRVRLSRRGPTTLLEVDGAGGRIERTLPSADGCRRNVDTAALIVDGALDELHVSRSAPRVGPLTAPAAPAPPPASPNAPHVSVSAGAGAQQGAIRVVPTFDVEGAIRVRAFEATLGADLGLSSTTPFAVAAPEEGGGTFTTTTFSAVLGLGAAPALGPGRANVGGVVGAQVTTGSASSPAPLTLFDTKRATSAVPFGGIRAGYTLDLPRGFFVAARAEERLAKQAAFQITGGASFPALHGATQVTTPLFSFRAIGLVGLHFF